VESTHILFDADYDLYIDGELVKEWRMSPNNYLQTTYNYRTLITEDSRYIEVKVISTGGGTGAQVDSVKVLVGTGADYNITLRA
jgi:ribosomal protein S9